MTTGIELIAIERVRQLTTKRYNTRRDVRMYRGGELAIAAAWYTLRAACIATVRGGNTMGLGMARHMIWPFKQKPDPKTPIRNLVKAGALIAAEIDRRLSEGETS